MGWDACHAPSTGRKRLPRGDRRRILHGRDVASDDDERIELYIARRSRFDHCAGTPAHRAAGGRQHGKVVERPPFHGRHRLEGAKRPGEVKKAMAWAHEESDFMRDGRK